jgi:hypothetical protein
MTLSEKICKSAGIPPIIVLSYNINDFDTSKMFNSEQEIKEFVDNFNDKPSKKFIIRSRQYIYPDLEKNNNNFVKLLECLASNGWCPAFCGDKSHTLIDVTLLLNLKHPYDKDIHKAPSFKVSTKKQKQALQQQEWEY